MLGRHDTVRANLADLRLLLDVLDPRDDSYGRVELTGGKRDHDILVVGFAASDDATRSLDSSGLHDVIVRGVTEDHRNVRELGPGVLRL